MEPLGGGGWFGLGRALSWTGLSGLVVGGGGETKTWSWGPGPEMAFVGSPEKDCKLVVWPDGPRWVLLLGWAGGAGGGVPLADTADTVFFLLLMSWLGNDP